MTKYILCFGDSNTWGYDPRSYFGSRYASPWPKLLAEETGWQVQNRGENGREIPKSMPECNCDLLILMLGTNDLLQGNTPAQVSARMETFLQTVKVPVLLLAPPPMKLGAWVPNNDLVESSRALASHYRNLSRQPGILFADAGEWNIPLAFDGVHFTEEGHRIFAEHLIQTIEKHLCQP